MAKSKESTVLVSFDIGNGYVKVRGPGDVRSSYPSVISKISDVMDGFDFSLNGETKRVVGYRDERYAVGESVYFDGLTPVSIAHRSRLGSPFYRVLFASALVEALDYSTDVQAVVSLPPAAYWDKEHQKSALSGVYEVQSIAFGGSIKSNQFNVDANRMRVIPEGLGSVCVMALDEQGRERKDSDLAHTVCGIVDVGTYTSDLIQIDQLRIVRSGCATLTHALHGVHQRLLDHVSSYGVDLQAYRADDVMRAGYFLHGGKRISILDELQQWGEELTEAVDAQIRTTWNGGENVEYIIVTGGGAPLIERMLKDRFPHVQIINDIEPFFANCEGGYRYGLLRNRLAK